MIKITEKLKMLKFYDGELNYHSINIKLCIVPENLMPRQIHDLVLIVPIYQSLRLMTFMLIHVTQELRELIIILNRKTCSFH